MHDTAVLRARIQAALQGGALASLGLGVALTGCDPDASSGRAPASQQGRELPVKAEKAAPVRDPRLWTPLDDSVYIIQEGRAFGESGPTQPDQWG
ncbi:MAG: hypothetical protein KC468_23200, partial [Myxococcales bacterium]|nr:hypothetical protein [Myxococcales bacterium]